MNRRTFLNPFAMFQTRVELPAPPANLKGESLELTKNTPTRFYMRNGTAPTTTIIDGVLYDAVMFVDNDGPKVRTSDGRVFSMTRL